MNVIILTDAYKKDAEIFLNADYIVQMRRYEAEYDMDARTIINTADGLHVVVVQTPEKIMRMFDAAAKEGKPSA